MALYRVDKRLYEDSEIIECNASSYYDETNFSDNKRAIEDLLNEKRPNLEMPIRNQCLFIFNELSDAVSFWIKMTNSSIYEVERCDDTKMYFRGDMNITDFMQHTSDPEVLATLADQYWSQVHTFKPCIEILVNKIKVVRKITNGEVQRKTAYSEYSSSGKRIESLTFYKANLPR